MTIDLSSIGGVTEVFETPNLEKDLVFNLEKAEPTLTKVHAGLQWDAGDDCDLDLSVFALHENGKIKEVNDFLYYDKMVTAPGLQKSGDNRTGAGDGDDEWLDITFANVKPSVDKIVLVVTIYKAQEKRQNFGMVQSALIHLDNADTDKTLAQFKLTDDYSTDTAIVVGEFIRSTQGWSFHAIGEGSTKTLGDYVNLYK